MMALSIEIECSIEVLNAIPIVNDMVYPYKKMAEKSKITATLKFVIIQATLM
jgi:hypothetical protein